jgi:hypothetical protein
VSDSELWPPIDTPPDRLWPPYDEPHARHPGREGKQAALEDAVLGVELGAYDTWVLARLAGEDTPVVATLVSLIHRARLASQ